MLNTGFRKIPLIKLDRQVRGPNDEDWIPPNEKQEIKELRPDTHWYNKAKDTLYLLEVTVPYANLCGDSTTLERSRIQKEEKYVPLKEYLENHFHIAANLIIVIVSSLGNIETKTREDLESIIPVKRMKPLLRRIVHESILGSWKIWTGIGGNNIQRNQRIIQEDNTPNEPIDELEGVEEIDQLDNTGQIGQVSQIEEGGFKDEELNYPNCYNVEDMQTGKVEQMDDICERTQDEVNAETNAEAEAGDDDTDSIIEEECYADEYEMNNQEFGNDDFSKVSEEEEEEENRENSRKDPGIGADSIDDCEYDFDSIVAEDEENRNIQSMKEKLETVEVNQTSENIEDKDKEKESEGLKALFMDQEKRPKASKVKDSLIQQRKESEHHNDVQKSTQNGRRHITQSAISSKATSDDSWPEDMKWLEPRGKMKQEWVEEPRQKYSKRDDQATDVPSRNRSLWVIDGGSF